MLLNLVVALCLTLFQVAIRAEEPQAAAKAVASQDDEQAAGTKGLLGANAEDQHKKPSHCRKHSSSSSSLSHRRANRCCPKTRKAIVDKYSLSFEKLLKEYSFADVLNLFGEGAAVHTYSPSCISPLGECCISTSTPTDWLLTFGVAGTYDIYFLNQNYDSTTVLPNGDVQYTTVMVIANPLVAIDFETHQVEIVWKKLPWCCDFLISDIKYVVPGCASDINRDCSECD